MIEIEVCDESMTLSLSPEQKEQLEQIALQFGQTWGNEQPNISKLMRAIADGELKVAWGDEEIVMTAKQRGAIKAAIKTIGEGLSRLAKIT